MAKKKRKERSDTERSADFKRLAEIRANKALRGIDGLTALANKGRYTWTPKQIDALKSAFSDRLEACFDAFASAEKGGEKKTTGIELPE